MIGQDGWLSKERNWWKIIIALWSVILLIPFFVNEIGRYLPASYWYDLKSVKVTNLITKEGGRAMQIDREIKHNFTGNWITSEELLTDDGWTAVRICIGTAPYRTDKALPKPPTKKWWIGDKCTVLFPFKIQPDGELPHGTYRLCTSVDIPTRFGKKTESECSEPYFEPNPAKVFMDFAQ